MPHHTDLVHVKIKFRDTFSGAIDIKTTSVSRFTFEKMKTDIGKIIPHFSDNIRWNWEIISVEQA